MSEPVEIKITNKEAYDQMVNKFSEEYAKRLLGWFNDSMKLIEGRAGQKLTWRYLIFQYAPTSAQFSQSDLMRINKKTTSASIVGATGGGRATGHLARSLTHEVISDSPDNLEGRVGTNVKYAKVVEFGTKIGRHWVPFEKHPEIEDWARKHGVDVNTRSGMMVTGKPTPFLGPALQESLGEIWFNLNRVAKL